MEGVKHCLVPHLGCSHTFGPPTRNFPGGFRFPVSQQGQHESWFPESPALSGPHLSPSNWPGRSGTPPLEYH